MAIQYGSSSSDSLTGGSGDDAIYGGTSSGQGQQGDGNDTLSGAGGNDSLYGGIGNDSLSGDADNDRLFGGSGSDALYGGDGNDLLVDANLNSGNGTVVGDSANDADSLFGGDGNDTLLASNGNDTLSGGDGNDTLSGGNHNDSLTGGDGDDALYGGNGSDDLTGGDGDDLLNGGDSELLTASDTFRFTFKTELVSNTVTFADYLIANGYGQYVENGLVKDGIPQNVFAQQYTAWLNGLVASEGLGVDLDGDGKISVGINQNDPTGLPQIEGLTEEEVDALFNGTDNLFVKTGKVSQERYYSNEFGSSMFGVTGEGHDTIDGLDSVDTIVLNGLAGVSDALLEQAFDLQIGDFDNDGVGDTRLVWVGGSITILGTTEWGTDVVSFMHDEQVTLL